MYLCLTFAHRDNNRGALQPFQRESLNRIAGSDGNLILDSFVEWYLMFMFKGDDDEPEEEEREFKVSGLVQVAPKDGEAWRCPTCRVINTWTTRRCIACDSLAPHAVRRQYILVL